MAKRTCLLEGCPRPHKARGYCELHARRIKVTGDPHGNIPSLRAVTVQHGWTVTGNGCLNADGYRLIKVNGHPNAFANGMIGEHRFVMSGHLGRPLHTDESVHHKNGIRTDNRIENLELRTRYHGKGQSVTDRIADAIMILERYAPDLLVKSDTQLRVAV